MTVARPFAAVLAAVALASALVACGVPPDPSREQPALASAVADALPALRAAGISKIHAWSDRLEQPVQVTSAGGPLYFPYPRGMPLARFALHADAERVVVLSDDYDPAAHDRYVESMRRVIAESLRLAGENAARLETREKASR
ncbi:hypothetical protein BURK1_02367 [Burkholderiales bacterium]|nr:hypothetical protein BURK1_02367 [Burkholderiales bacterium]